MVPWNSASGGFAYIWQSKWVGIIAIKTEGTQIRFLSDVLVAVASLDLKSIFWRENVIAVVILVGVLARCRSGGKSYQMSICDRDRDFPHPKKITVLTFLVKKTTMKHSGVSIFIKCAKKPLVPWRSPISTTSPYLSRKVQRKVLRSTYLESHYRANDIRPI